MIFNFHLEYDIDYSAMASLVVWSLGKHFNLDLLLQKKTLFWNKYGWYCSIFITNDQTLKNVSPSKFDF